LATNYNITQKQYNGNDYDTLYPKNTSQQVLLNDSTLATALGLSGTPTINDVVTALSSQGARVVFGSYTGTGTVGSTNPNAVSFTGAGKLQAFIITTVTTSTLCSGGYLWLRDRSSGAITYSNSDNLPIFAQISWADDSISWYVSSVYTADYQCNTSSVTYYYMAILTR